MITSSCRSRKDEGFNNTSLFVKNDPVDSPNRVSIVFLIEITSISKAGRTSKGGASLTFRVSLPHWGQIDSLRMGILHDFWSHHRSIFGP